MAPINDVVDVLPKIKALALADRAMFDRGMRAFVSFVQAYAKHECSIIFRIKGEATLHGSEILNAMLLLTKHIYFCLDLDFAALARGFALLRLPKMPELRGKTLPDFMQTHIDTDTIKYKDKNREKQRQKMLKELKEKPKTWPDKKNFIKNQAWSRQKNKKERRKKKAAKRKHDEVEHHLAIALKYIVQNTFTQVSLYPCVLQASDIDEEDMKELLSDTRLLKKLKKGQITEEDFEKQITGESKSKHKTGDRNDSSDEDD